MSGKGLAKFPTKEDLPDWKNLLGAVLNGWSSNGSGVVISADVDGLMSCALLALKYPAHVVGIYTTTHLLLLDGATQPTLPMHYGLTTTSVKSGCGALAST